MFDGSGPWEGWASAGGWLLDASELDGWSSDDVFSPWEQGGGVVGTPAEDAATWHHQGTDFTCAVVSQQMILEQFGVDVSEAQLVYDAVTNGWLAERTLLTADSESAIPMTVAPLRTHPELPGPEPLSTSVNAMEPSTEAREMLARAEELLEETQQCIGKPSAESEAMREKQLNGAFRHAQAACDLEPKWAESFSVKSKVLSAQSEHTLAIAAITVSLRLRPDHPEGRGLRGSYKFASGDFSGARQDLDEQIRRCPSQGWYVLRAAACARSGKSAAAVADLRTAIELTQQQTARGPLCAIAGFLSHRVLQSPSDAVPLYRQALSAISPNETSRGILCPDKVADEEFQLTCQKFDIPALTSFDLPNAVASVQRHLWQAIKAIHGQPVGQRHALDEVADDKDRVPLAAHLVDADDVGMAQLSGCPGLAQELLGLLRIELPFSRNLQSSGAVRLRVPRLPHETERAHTDLLDRVEVADGLRPCLVGHRLSGAQQTEAAPTCGTCDVGKLAVAGQLDGRVALGTADLHGVRSAGSRSFPQQPPVCRAAGGEASYEERARWRGGRRLLFLVFVVVIFTWSAKLPLAAEQNVPKDSPGRRLAICRPRLTL